MKKDLQSHDEHDKDYQTVFNLPNSLLRIKKYEETRLFTYNGFENAVKEAAPICKIHIDIGCGTGWLLLKTAPYFKRVIGIDPSINAVQIASEITKSFPHVTYLNKDMIDGVESLKVELSPNEPVFVTTAVVLSHIKDGHVEGFLKTLNSLPHNSHLYFDEPYGTNIQQNMWHVRSKKWWADTLNEWSLTFMDRPGIYTHGIFGKKIGRENRTMLYDMSPKEHVLWFADGINNKIKRIVRGVKRHILHE